jgi:protein-ribulosamine 3-kinase
MSVPEFLLNHLRKLDPDASFSGHLPKVSSSSGKNYFVKTGSSGEREQYEGEAESLDALAKAAPGLVPKVLDWGENGGKPYFISEYMTLGPLTDEAGVKLAKRMADEMHRFKSENGKFGFEVPTYCGATRMKNGWFDTWEECYSEMIGDLLASLRQRGRYAGLCEKGEEIRKTVILKLLGLTILNTSYTMFNTCLQAI